MNSESFQIVEEQRVRYPALEAFLAPMEQYFCFFPAFKTRLYRSLAQASLEDSLVALQSDGILPGLDPNDFPKITQLWNSKLFQTYLGAIGFAPPEKAVLSEVLGPPIQNTAQFQQHSEQIEARYGLLDHWEGVLHKTCPELFLFPFLSAEQKTGCDLACGWGRGALTVLLRSPELFLHCCDSSQSSLKQLEDLAAKENLTERVRCHQCFLPDIPLADDSLDFAVAFDIFELLPDSVLMPFLDEILRVCRLSAVLYFKITLHAYQPVLGQVQNFSPGKVQSLFEGRRVNGKSMRLEHHDRRAREHFTFRVVTTPVEPTQAKDKAKSRTARLRGIRRR